MSTDIATSACAQCSHHNESQAKFCGGCGQPLWETCSKCEATVRIGIKFCGGCGEDLQQRFSQRLQQAEDALRRARQLAEAFEYADALALTNRHRQPADFRFQSVADKCQQLAGQIERARDAWQAKSAKVLDAARRAFEAEEHAKLADEKSFRGFTVQPIAEYAPRCTETKRIFDSCPCGGGIAANQTR